MAQTPIETDPVPIPWVSAARTVSFGVIIVRGGAIAETADATPRKTTAWNAAGISRQMICSHVTNDIECVRGGVYSVTFTGSFSGSKHKNFHLAIYVEGVDTNFHTDRTLGNSNEIGSCSVSGIIRCARGEKISVYYWSTDGGTELTMTEATLTAFWIGD